MENLNPTIQEERILIATINDCHFNGINYPAITDLDFFHVESKRLFKTILAGSELNANIELLQKILGEQLFDFLEVFPNKVQAFEHVLPKLRDLRKRRESISEAQEKIKSAIDTNIPIVEKTQLRTLANGLESVDTDARMNRNGIRHGQWGKFETITGGLRLGEVIGIAGESECGKTTFAKNWLHLINQNVEGIKTAVISLEEEEEQFIQSVATMTLKMSRKELIWSIHNKDGFDVKKVYKDYSGWQNCSFSYESYSLNQINSFIEAERPHVCLIDHAQFITQDPKMSQGQWMNHMCNSLKKIAKRYRCAIIILSQIDKASAKSHSIGGKTVKKKPTLADAYGGIGFKSALDAGYVICRDKDESIVYCDKCRKPWEVDYRYHDFTLRIDGASQVVKSVTPIEKQMEETKPFWENT